MIHQETFAAGRCLTRFRLHTCASQTLADPPWCGLRGYERLRRVWRGLGFLWLLSGVSLLCGAQPDEVEPTDDSAAAECVPIETVEVSGARLLSAPMVHGITSPYEQRCLGVGELDDLLEALTLWYVERGYVASRAYLPEQDLGDETLSIVVVEGELEAIVMNDEPGKHDWLIGAAFPGLIGRPVNLRELEQGLEQLNRLRSNAATMELQAGQELGGTVVAISNETGRRWHGSLTVDNLGGPSSGQQQVRLGLGHDDLLGLADGWDASYQRSTDGPVWLFDANGVRSDTWTAGVSVPLGWWAMSGQWLRSRYWTPIPGELGQIDMSGSTTKLALTVSRVVQRDGTSKTTVSGTAAWEDNETKVMGHRVEVSSGSVALGEVELAHQRQVGGGTGTASVGVKSGPIAWDTAADRFAVLSGAVGWTASVAVGHAALFVSGKLWGQWSEGAVRTSQQQSLGGPGSVRGVQEPVTAGNRAAFLRTDLGLALPTADEVSVELTGGLDAGGVLTQAERGIVGGGAIGGTVGIRLGVEWLAIELSYGELLLVSQGLLDDGGHPGGRITAQASARF